VKPARAGARQGLEALGADHAGTGIEKRAEIVAEGRFHHDHVVFLRTRHIEKLERRFDPAYAVLRLGIAGDFGRHPVLTCLWTAPVIHAVELSVLDHRDVGGKNTLPGFVELERDPLAPRFVHLQSGAFQLVDHMVIHEELEAAADIQHLFLP
jgi:hypothetical protein